MHPVNYPCGRKPKNLEKTLTFGNRASSFLSCFLVLLLGLFSVSILTKRNLCIFHIRDIGFGVIPRKRSEVLYTLFFSRTRAAVRSNKESEHEISSSHILWRALRIGKFRGGKNNYSSPTSVFVKKLEYQLFDNKHAHGQMKNLPN